MSAIDDKGALLAEPREPPKSEDPLLAELRALPAPEMDGRRTERARLRAQRVLAEERDLMTRPALRPFVRFFADAFVPALVVGTAGAYLFFVLRAAASLYH